MAEVSLTGRLTTLEGTFSEVLALTGQADDNGTGGTGLAGAAALISTGPGLRVNDLGNAVTEQLATVLAFDAPTALAGPTDVFPQLVTRATAAPVDALRGYQDVLDGLRNAVETGVADVQRAVASVRTVADRAPRGPEELFRVLLDQALAVLAVLDTPQARTVTAWAESVSTMAEELGPLLEAGHPPDPDLALALVRRSLDRILNLLGLAEARTVVDFVADLATAGPDQRRRQAIGLAVDAAEDAYREVIAATAGSAPTFREAVAAAADALAAVTDEARAGLGTAHRIARAPLLQREALADRLRALLDEALGVQIADAQRIEDPFGAVLDRIDAAIAGIDLSSVCTDVTDAFTRMRADLAALDPAGLAGRLAPVLQPWHQAADTLAGAAADLQAALGVFADGAVRELRDLLAPVGEFGPDGSFRFAFAGPLHELLATAELLVTGDPGLPDTPCLVSRLAALGTELDGLFRAVAELLGPVRETLPAAAKAATDGIGDFHTYLEGLGLDRLTGTLTTEVRAVLDGLGEVDFDVVVDQVVAELVADRDALAAIDPTRLNGLLRAALKAALEILINIDFTETVRAPLRSRFDELRAVPASGLSHLQQAYTAGLERLLALRPQTLLEDLLGPFDVLQQELGQLELTALTAPLDELHARLLQEPLAALDPGPLLRPLSDRYAELTAALGAVDGARITAPLTQAAATVQAAVLAVDVAAPFDALLQAIDALKAALASLKPSEALAGLAEAFRALPEALDAVKPSTLMAPLTRLAAPLTDVFAALTAEAIQSLHAAFTAPLATLDGLAPDRLEGAAQGGLDAVRSAVNGLGLRTAQARLRGAFLDLRAEVGDDPDRLAMVALLDPDDFLTPVVSAQDRLLAELATLRDGISLTPLKAAYAELRERLLDLLPPYAREVLDPDTFRRLAALADPTQALAELDARFDALRARLLPITPDDLAAELDAMHAEVVAQVELLDLAGPVHALRDDAVWARDAIAAVRIDVLTVDVDRALADVRAVAAALDPALLVADLTPVHRELAAAVAAARPSLLLAGLAEPLEAVQGSLSAVGTLLLDPLDAAWTNLESELTRLTGLNLTPVLGPVLDKLDAVEVALEDALGRVEGALDDVLRAARAVI